MFSKSDLDLQIGHADGYWESIYSIPPRDVKGPQARPAQVRNLPGDLPRVDKTGMAGDLLGSSPAVGTHHTGRHMRAARA
jgi:hypothetical protein